MIFIILYGIIISTKQAMRCKWSLPFAPTYCHKPLFWSLTNHYIIINNICVSLTTLVLIDVYICANLAYNFSFPACRLEHMCVSVCGYIHREHGDLCEFHLANCTVGFFFSETTAA